MQIYKEPASCQLLNYLMNGRNDAHTQIHATFIFSCCTIANWLRNIRSIRFEVQLTHGLQSLEELNDLPPFLYC